MSFPRSGSDVSLNDNTNRNKAYYIATVGEVRVTTVDTRPPFSPRSHHYKSNFVYRRPPKMVYDYPDSPLKARFVRLETVGLRNERLTAFLK
ncbi:hypothetical protein EVAR_6359_1 [Eumeta japonica]|uniref:Uncharacterized protein n=1 Tax=Eumeta variegata TaxID=151549 RepID=A0A4C1TD89_EUMVA|nr:hypothetical protein EVAR_6359_1 [Eumeta japonica]